MRTALLLLLAVAGVHGQLVINTATPAMGGFTIGAGGCFTQAVTATGATVGGMTVNVSPRTFPGNGVTWEGYVSATNTATVKVCNSISGFVGASIYDVNVVTGVAGSSVAFGFSFPPGIGVGATAYLTVPFACTINAWSMTATTGTATVDVWKIGTGTALPTISNTITAAATPDIATGNVATSSTLTGWTTSVAAMDVVGFNLKVISDPTARVGIVLSCLR